ncbi:MAG: hypothetical protein KKG59_05355 [Nanoarchaeota archaeon]|nr:hypothetical protein [Nanoarchaeota archaeon]
MVKIPKLLYDKVAASILRDDEKSSILDYILEEEYTVLEAEGIYNKVKQITDSQRKPVSYTQVIKREIPKYKVVIGAFLAGVGFPLVYYLMLPVKFSPLWGIPWMVYVFGKWFFCLFTGNLPAMFQENAGIMVAKCNFLGPDSELIKAIFNMGGMAFSMILGGLLIIYMVHLSRFYFADRESSPGVKRAKYFKAWINGAIGFACLTTIPYALLVGITGEMWFDVSTIAIYFGVEVGYLIDLLLVVCGVIWLATLITAGIFFWKTHRLLRKV